MVSLALVSMALNFVEVFAVDYLYQLAVEFLVVYFAVVSFAEVVVSVDFVYLGADYSAVAATHHSAALVVPADQEIHPLDLQDNLQVELELELIDLMHLKQLFVLDQHLLSFH